MGLIRNVVLLLLLVSLSMEAQNLVIYRKNYIDAVKNKALCFEMIQALKKENKQPIYIAYLGAYQTIWANHVINPFAKLKTFNEGKKNIEKAVYESSDNIEIRILRYSVQENAPNFLNYKMHLHEDVAFIKKEKSKITDPILLQLIYKI